MYSNDTSVVAESSIEDAVSRLQPTDFLNYQFISSLSETLCIMCLLFYVSFLFLNNQQQRDIFHLLPKKVSRFIDTRLNDLLGFMCGDNVQ